MQDQAIINFHESRDFGGKMHATYGFIKQNYKGLLKSMLFFAAPPVLLGGVFLSEMFYRTMSLSRSGGVMNSPFGVEDYFDSVTFVLKLFAALLFLLLGGVFTISTTYAYMLVYKEKGSANIELSDVWKKVKKLFWTNFGTMILYYIGATIGSVVLLLPLTLIVFVATLIHPFLIFISVFLYYGGIIFLAVYFSMVFFIRCYERIGFFDALGRLFKLTKNKLWSTFAIGGINMYIQMAFSIVLILPWYIYFIVTSLHQLTPYQFEKQSFAEELLTTLFFTLYSLGNTLLYALPLIAMAFQYFNLVELREAKGLIARLDTFGQRYSQATHEDY